MKHKDAYFHSELEALKPGMVICYGPTCNMLSILVEIQKKERVCLVRDTLFEIEPCQTTPPFVSLESLPKEHVSKKENISKALKGPHLSLP